MGPVTTPPRLGVCFPRELEPSVVVDFADRLEAGGVDELWIVEDCFYTGAITLAATALSKTERLSVGLGILPATTRNVSTMAMELATLARLAPGRVIGGIGHGLRAWMEQIGARPASPVTTLAEVITSVRRLLAGETVTIDGETVRLREVRLDAVPPVPPPVLAGVRRHRSLAVAGDCADGLILTELTGPTVVRDSIATASPGEPFQSVVYTVISIDDDRAAARRAIAPFIADNVDHGLNFGLNSVSFYADLVAALDRDGIDGLAAGPDEWWIELGAIGTPDDVAAHVAALAEAGATSVSFIPPPDARAALAQVDRIVAEVVGR
jgi:alkanesulfonate monooxygenase SsuD/methylene tetrahydromethanopterin reductase-like flavin-dependent oxidoreductase (luciferase family)